MAHSIKADALCHRTKLMTEKLAASFAKCLEANPRFVNVTVEISNRAKGERKHFVSYQPRNEERQGEMVQSEQDARQARAEEQASEYLFVIDDTRRFHHCLSFVSGEVYEVCHQSCSCPDAKYRSAAVGPCKHVRMLRSGLALIQPWHVAAGTPAPESAGDLAAQRERERVALWD